MSRKQRRRQAKIARSQSGNPSENNPDYALQMAGQLFQSGNLDQAIKILDDARHHNPEHFGLTHGLAIIHATRGNLDGALPLFEKAVTIRPDDDEAQFNLGQALAGKGRLDEAIVAYRRSLEINPHEEGPLINLGNVYKNKNDFMGAEDCFRRALEINPGNALLHANLGIVLVNLGRLEEAVASYQDALALKPDYAEAYTNLGNALKNLGRLEEAVASHQKAIALKPNYAETHTSLGNAFKNLGRLEEAVASHRKALTLKPDFVEAHHNLGTVFADMGRFEDAVASYQEALSFNPDYAEAHTFLGNAFKNLDRMEEAVASHRKALAIKPDYAEAYYNLGTVFYDLGQMEDAVVSYEKALALKPNYPEANNNLGMVLMELSRQDESLACYRRAVAIDPDNAQGHYNLGLTLLLLGKMQEGWDEYEWRWDSENAPPKRDFPQAPWQGEDPADKTVLVWCEQGVGDEILFAGMIPPLVGAGARVILDCDPRMMDVFARSFPDVTCIAESDPPDPRLVDSSIDYQISAGSLGRWLRRTTDPRPGPAAYLVADEVRRDALKERYQAENGGLLVGVTWNSKNKLLGEKKSLPLSELAPLAGVAGVTLVDLQYGDTQAERDAFATDTGTEILHDDSIDQMADLDAFAAQVTAMDLVITVSNTTAHFAGALGVPTWVMLNTAPLPCWMLDRDDSPWYPSATLFRQPLRGCWPDVIKSVFNRLSKY